MPNIASFIPARGGTVRAEVGQNAITVSPPSGVSTSQNPLVRVTNHGPSVAYVAQYFPGESTIPVADENAFPVFAGREIYLGTAGAGSTFSIVSERSAILDLTYGRT